MKIILILAAIFAANFANAQVAQTTKFELVPAVRTTTEIKGQSYVIKRDENNKIIFVRIQTENPIVKPMLITIITEPKLQSNPQK